jgi:hypothetical protein
MKKNQRPAAKQKHTSEAFPKVAFRQLDCSGSCFFMKREIGVNRRSATTTGEAAVLANAVPSDWARLETRTEALVG